FSRRTGARRGRLFSTWTPPTTRCTGIRRGAFFTAITTATAICRSMSFVAGICWPPNCAGRISMPVPGRVGGVARILARNRARWPAVRVLLRADSGFAREGLMRWCELNGVDYLFGLARNPRLTAVITAELDAARRHSERTGRPARCFKDFTWSTLDSWSRERRVVAKAEWTGGGGHPRLVGTPRPRAGAPAPPPLREKPFCRRRDGRA